MSLTLNQKRAVTEIVSYVLLVIIAFALSALVYGYLQLQAPKDRPHCPEGVSFAVQEATCFVKPKKSGTTSDVTITLVNNGRRSIQGAYVRLGLKDQKVKELLNKEAIFFTSTPTSEGKYELTPGQSITQRYQNKLAITKAGSYAVEIEPVIGTPGKIALCENAVITRTVQCGLPRLPTPAPQFIEGVYSSPAWSNEIWTLAFPPSELTSYVSHMEVNLYKKDGSGNWQPTVPPNHEVPFVDDGDVWSGLSAGTYRVEGFVFLFNGDKLEKVPIKDDTRGTSREITFAPCVATCNDHERSDVVFFDWTDGHRSVYNTQKCDSSSTYFRFICNNRCLHEGQPIDNSIISFSTGLSCSSGQQCTTVNEFITLNGVPESWPIGRCS